VGGRGQLIYPSKDFEKLDHKNAIKHENRRPPPRFSHNPKYPPSREFENECASTMIVVKKQHCNLFLKQYSSSFFKV
jgi:hypothetical protein